jgi:hypothetical protein
MAAFKTDGTYTTAVISGPARKSLPFEGDASSFIVEQDFMVAFASYTPLALNTAHPTFTTAYLVRESALEDMGGGIATFTRTYATIPASRNEYESFATFFPGLFDTTAAVPPYNQYWAGTGNGKDPITKKVTSRLRHEYFLCAAGQTYTSPDLIPVLPAIKYTLVSNPEARAQYLLPEGDFWSDSDPSREDWEALIAGGAGLGTGANAGEFIAEDSDVRRWAGNIYERVTRYVKASAG